MCTRVLLPAALLAPFPPVGEAAARTPEGGPADAFVESLLDWATRAIEVAGVAVLVAGLVVATALYVRRLRSGDGTAGAFRAYRSDIGRSILLGLEFLVAADILNTVAIEPSLESLAVLAGIVLIRTFLSFSLEIEIEGRPPWRRGGSGGGDLG